MPSKSAVGLVLGPVVFAAMLLAPPPPDLATPAWYTAAVASLMAIWWLTEAIPIPATALIPIVVFPLVGAGTISEATAPYANPIIFLFMGGFLLALSMQRWELHRRIALLLLSRAGSKPSAVIGGFMAVTAFLSMWVSNTAVALMMLPIGLSVVEVVAGDDDTDADGGSRAGFATALMLGIAFAANVGGMGTLIGTPPNALLAGYLSDAHGIEVGFGEWMKLGVPVVLITLPAVFLILTRVSARLKNEEIPGVGELIASQLAGLGRLTSPELRVAIVFLMAASLWIARPFLSQWVPGLSDAGIGIGCGVLLFILPSGERNGALLDWDTAARLPWGVLILFGGGLSLAAAIDRTGLNTGLGSAATGLADWPPVLFVLMITAVVILLTELTSNTATAAAFLPVLGAVALQVGWDPRVLVVPAALAASCAFMLPIATPPNAVAFSSGRVTIGQMARAGVWINVAATVLITLAVMLLMPLLLGVDAP